MPTEFFAAKAAATALSMVINGVPVQATYLNGELDACQMSSRTAKHWRSSGKKVIEERVADWCTVGTVIADRWVSEQWRSPSSGSVRPSGRPAFGWRIEMPLSSVGSPNSPGRVEWPLDILDFGISSRIRFRQSARTLDAHHRESQALVGDFGKAIPIASTDSATSGFLLSQAGGGDLLLSGPHPDGGSYSIVIKRGFGK